VKYTFLVQYRVNGKPTYGIAFFFAFLTFVILYMVAHMHDNFIRVVEAPGTAVAQWLRHGRSLIRFQVVSLEFFIDTTLPIALWPWGRLSF